MRGKAGPKQYVLRSKLRAEVIDRIGQIVESELPEDKDDEDSWTKDDGSILDWKHGDELGQLGVLSFILAVILAHGRRLDDRKLHSYLKRLNIDDTWKPPCTPASAHPPLRLTALLAQFCRQNYLECSNPNVKNEHRNQSQAVLKRQHQADPSSNNPDQELEWRWGPRAEIEFGELQIAQFMNEIYRAKEHTTVQDQDQTQRAMPILPTKQYIHNITKSAGSELQDANTMPTGFSSSSQPEAIQEDD